MRLQGRGTIRIVRGVHGLYKLVLRGLNGLVIEDVRGDERLDVIKGVAKDRSAFNGFVVLAYHETPIIYWCRERMVGQHRIKAHDIVEAREVAARLYLDPSDVATTPHPSLPTF